MLLVKPIDSPQHQVQHYFTVWVIHMGNWKQQENWLAGTDGMEKARFWIPWKQMVKSGVERNLNEYNLWQNLNQTAVRYTILPPKFMTKPYFMYLI